MQSAQKKSTNNKPLLWVLAAFALPVIAAKLVLSQHWYQGGVTNQGVLFSSSQAQQHPHEWSLQAFNLNNIHAGKWQILYQLPSPCSQTCLTRIHLLRQSHLALGREQARVKTLLLQPPKQVGQHTATQQATQQAKVSNDHAMPLLPSTPTLAPLLSDGKIVIVDPLGNFVMYYPQVSEEESLLQGKALLRDLKKLLKLSRIG